jgi:hypothetical protein
MLRLADIRKTTRRSGKDGGPRAVYPHLLRDRTLAPRIEMTVRYLEGMVGCPRSELDPEMVVQLFGDHKLARCIVACLGASYRHQARTFAGVLDEPDAWRLAGLGVSGPSELRLWLYRRANATLRGVVARETRAAFVAGAAEALGLVADQIDPLATLDAPANAVLVRTGPVPTSDEVIARYNYETLAALLASAKLARISLVRAPREVAAIRDLCALLGVRADLGGRELVLHGRQDALNNWARNGARLVRLVTILLACGLAATSGQAIIAEPGGGEWLLRLDAEAWGMLGAPAARGREPLFTVADYLAALRRVETLGPDFAELRRAGLHEAWSVTRRGDLLAGGVPPLPVLAACVRGNERVALVPLPANPDGRAALAESARRTPLMALAGSGIADAYIPMEVHGGDLPVWRTTSRDDTAALPALLSRTVARTARQAQAAQLDAVLAAAREGGVFTEARLAEWLGCAEDDVPARLRAPEAQSVREAPGVYYVEGFGLCSLAVLDQARAAAAEVARLRGDQPVGRAWTARVLGRKLREVTGASEGIECLIAYLGAA